MSFMILKRDRTNSLPFSGADPLALLQLDAILSIWPDANCSFKMAIWAFTASANDDRSTELSLCALATRSKAEILRASTSIARRRDPCYRTRARVDLQDFLEVCKGETVGMLSHIVQETLRKRQHRIGGKLDLPVLRIKPSFRFTRRREFTTI